MKASLWRRLEADGNVEEGEPHTKTHPRKHTRTQAGESNAHLVSAFLKVAPRQLHGLAQVAHLAAIWGAKRGGEGWRERIPLNEGPRPARPACRPCRGRHLRPPARRGAAAPAPCAHRCSPARHTGRPWSPPGPPGRWHARPGRLEGGGGRGSKWVCVCGGGCPGTQSLHTRECRCTPPHAHQSHAWRGHPGSRGCRAGWAARRAPRPGAQESPEGCPGRPGVAGQGSAAGAAHEPGAAPWHGGRGGTRWRHRRPPQHFLPPPALSFAALTCPLFSGWNCVAQTLPFCAWAGRGAGGQACVGQQPQSWEASRQRTIALPSPSSQPHLAHLHRRHKLPAVVAGGQHPVGVGGRWAAVVGVHKVDTAVAHGGKQRRGPPMRVGEGRQGGVCVCGGGGKRQMHARPCGLQWRQHHTDSRQPQHCNGYSSPSPQQHEESTLQGPAYF